MQISPSLHRIVEMATYLHNTQNHNTSKRIPTKALAQDQHIASLSLHVENEIAIAHLPQLNP